MCRGEDYEQVDEGMNVGDAHSTKKCTSKLVEGRITLHGPGIIMARVIPRSSITVALLPDSDSSL